MCINLRCLEQTVNNKLELLAEITDTSLDEVYIFDTETFYFLYANKSAQKNLGYSLIELKKYTPADINMKISMEKLHLLLYSLDGSDKSFLEIQTKIQRKDFSFYNAKIIVKKIILSNAEYFVASVKDITKEVKLQKELKNLAMRDSLTGIYNRHKVNEIIDEEIIRQSRYNNSFALLMLDIDHFKSVNDNYGHGVGDIILQELSNLVVKNIRKSDKFARWGGEEFLIILPQTTAEGAFKYAQKLVDVIATYEFSEVSKLTISVGVSIYREGESKTEFLKRTDEALYIAKEKGRNRVIFKSDESIKY